MGKEIGSCCSVESFNCTGSVSLPVMASRALATWLTLQAGQFPTGGAGGEEGEARPEKEPNNISGYKMAAYHCQKLFSRPPSICSFDPNYFGI